MFFRRLTLKVPHVRFHFKAESDCSVRLRLKLQFSCASGKYVLSALNIEYTITALERKSATLAIKNRAVKYTFVQQG